MQAHLLFRLVPLIMIGLLAAPLSTLELPGTLWLWILVVVFAESTGLATLLLARRGHLMSACLIWIFSIWSFTLLFVFAEGGIRAPARVFLLLIVLMAGLLLGIHWGIILAVLSVLACLGFAFLENAGYLAEPVIRETIFSNWASFVLQSIVGIALIITTSEALKAAFAQSQRELDERILAEKRALEIATRLASALETAELGLFDWRIQSGEFYLDERFRAITGIPAQLENRAYDYIVENLHPIDKERTLTQLQAHLDGKSDRAYGEFRLSSPEKNWKWIHTVARVIDRDIFGNPLRLLAVFQDITSLKNAQSELIESEAIFRAITENASDAIILAAGEQGQIIYANPKAEIISGYSSFELCQLSIIDLLRPDERDKVLDIYQRRIKGEQAPAVIETVFRKPGGSDIPVETTAAQIAWKGVPASLAIVRDISERKKREAEIILRQHELEILAALAADTREIDKLDELGELILRWSIDQLGMENGFLALLDAEKPLILAEYPFTIQPPASASSLDRIKAVALKASEPIFISNDSQDGYTPEWIAVDPSVWPEHSAGAILPLRAYGNTIGVMALFCPPPREFNTASRRMAVGMADLGANALDKLRTLATLETRVADRTRDLSVLYQVMTIANQPIPLEQMLDQALKLSLQAVNCTDGGISLVDRVSPPLKPILAQLGDYPAQVDQIERLVNQGLAAEIKLNNKPLLIADLGTDGRFKPIIPPGLQGELIGVPLRASRGVVGILWGWSDQSGRLTLEDLSLWVSIGERIGATVEIASLHDQALQLAVLDERQRLARDLHDAVTQQIYSLLLFAGGMKRAIQTHDQDASSVLIKRIEEIAQQALKELRLLIYELRPLDLQKVGLVDALRNRLESVEKRAGVRIRLAVENPPGLPPEIEEDLFRIAIEALNNSLKHAAASEIDVRLRDEDGRMVMEISDNGKGFTTGVVKEGGSGLGNMRDRARKIGAVFDLTTSPGAGTTISVKTKAV